MNKQVGFFSSGELARLAGVSADTLRHYERKGVLGRPRRALNGYRQYPAEALPRVRLIRRALAVGFTLDELATILKERDRGGAPCAEVRAAAAAKLANVEAQLGEVIALRDELRSILNDWDEMLACRRPGERAGLLEALASRDGDQTTRHRTSQLTKLRVNQFQKRRRSK